MTECPPTTPHAPALPAPPDPPDPPAPPPERARTRAQPPRQAELAAFLRAKRARLRPEEVGLPDGPRRRTPGLRRQEVAQLAAVSVEWYVRLEQGRVGTPGGAVLDALAEALRLTPDEHRHLHRIARGETPVRPPTAAPLPRVRDSLRQLLDGIPLFPAYLTDHRLDVLAHNAAARALFGPEFGTGATDNTARMLFLDPATRTTQLDWSRVARETVGHLRTAAARHPADPRLGALLAELRLRSSDFALWWDDHTVLERSSGTKRVAHPEAGPLRLHYDILTTGDHHLFTLTPADPATDRALRRLVTAHTTDTAPGATVRPITAA
ncbi:MULTISPECIES: helix-turn-helix transcriptional regulator [Kitasatospora]|uniref:Putative DNA-binding protein n=1 Tax=Kitasatospora setae (strain ATCC 33774 / DSM 43861 / JCM 3304 / KCC A-0304 / NBRC 14216 / KM-6054) TaxID=452652 RepID=E4N3T1_KITSK|nr:MULTISPECIES: helix-turn-helix transcriptional regulator [Kitasatospora]BAJ31562.1 putative DNA-binding protein [Kitasatospora setae KM-6054]